MTGTDELKAIKRVLNSFQKVASQISPSGRRWLVEQIINTPDCQAVQAMPAPEVKP